MYYSAFSPIPDASSVLPVIPAPLLREHRLYQADWLLRFYGFAHGELTTADHPNLDLQLDPKTSWALRNRAAYPVDLNTADREMLLRVPGLGVRSVDRILAARTYRRVRLEDLKRLRVPLRRALPFIVADGHLPPQGLEAQDLADRMAPQRAQVDLFDSAFAAAHGEL